MSNINRTVRFGVEVKQRDGGNEPKNKFIDLVLEGKSFHKAKEFEKAIEIYTSVINEITELAMPQQNKILAMVYILRANVQKEKGEKELSLADQTKGIQINAKAARYIRVY